jgi:hypothetical protein
MARSSISFRTITASTIAIAMLGAFAVAASAASKGPFTVRAGVPVVVLSYASYDYEECTYLALPKLTIVTAPTHGTITLGKSSHVLDDGPCAGKTVKSSAVQYRANPGYHGTDSLSVVVEGGTLGYSAGLWGDRVDISLIVK